jgi:hypothetical protein
MTVLAELTSAGGVIRYVERDFLIAMRALKTNLKRHG